jgi:hypothetical protein
LTQAKIILEHGQFQVTEPLELVLWINVLQKTTASGEAKYAAYSKRLEGYFVHCAVSNEQIPLSNLKYWNVDRQESYKSAAEALSRYVPTTSCT